MQPRLTEGPVPRTLFHLTTPMLWGLLAMIVGMAIEMWFISRLGAQELAAYTFTLPVTMVLDNLAVGIGIGASSVVARAIGSGQVVDVRRYVLGSLWLGVLLIGVLCVLVWVWLDPLFKLLGADAASMPLIREFLAVGLWAQLAITLPIVGNSCLRAAGNAKFAGYNMVVVAVLNLVLCPLLIFGYGAVPGQGIAGAAWAALVSESVSVLICLYALRYRERVLARCGLGLATVWRAWRAVLHVGIPATANMMVPALVAGFTTALIAQSGPLAVAGYGVAGRLENFAVVVFWAMSSILGPMVGQNHGAGRDDRVAETIRNSNRFCIMAGLAGAVVLAVAGQPLARFFSDDPQVTAAASLYLWIVPASYGLWGVTMMVNAVLNGLGHPRPALYLTVFRQVILFIPLAWAGEAVLGLPGV